MDARILISEVGRFDAGRYPDSTLLSDMEGWDSLKSVRLVLRLEESVGRSLSEEDIEGLKSIGDIDRMLKGKG